MIKGVIFDMDGVLIDSERLFFRGWLQAADSLGLRLRDEALNDTIGMNRKQTEDYFHSLFTGGDCEAFFAESHKTLNTIIRKEGIPVKESAREILEMLHGKDIPMGLATSTARPIAERNLSELRLIGYFKATLCGGDITAHKPEAAFYTEAAWRIGLTPPQCLVFEDSVPGIIASSDAGATVIHMEDLARVPPEHLSRCRASYRSFSEVLPVLDDLLQT